ncbi:hypothetical protein JKG47_11805 [Acidithiobacillus sp. MC6.1]|nr:hypothetical protein [Acidithiobacillus sp. MC6.1]
MQEITMERLEGAFAWVTFVSGVAPCREHPCKDFSRGRRNGTVRISGIPCRVQPFQKWTHGN